MCTGGKLHHSCFEASKSQTKELLELVHSDVCGKMREKSTGGAEYFLTFTDNTPTTLGLPPEDERSSI